MMPLEKRSGWTKMGPDSSDLSLCKRRTRGEERAVEMERGEA